MKTTHPTAKRKGSQKPNRKQKCSKPTMNFLECPVQEEGKNAGYPPNLEDIHKESQRIIQSKSARQYQKPMQYGDMLAHIHTIQHVKMGCYQKMGPHAQDIAAVYDKAMEIMDKQRKEVGLKIQKKRCML